MADNLIFPIGFDLEKGVKDVISRSDTYLRQIEHAMNRKPIILKAEVDASRFQMFSRQFTNSIDGISAKLAQAQRLWNAMTFDVKFDADGNLSRRAQVVFDAFQQLTQASATMGQRLGEVNRNLAKSEQDTARAIAAEYDKRRQQVNEQIRLKERQAAAEERVRQGQLKGVNVGYVETQKQVEAVRNLRLQYEAILPMLNAMAQRRYDIKVGIDKQFEADIQRINAEIARLRQSNLQLGAKGDTNAIQANLQAIRQLEAELQRISQQKIDLLNSNKINSDLARLRTEISSVFGELQSAERRLAADNSLNAALDAQSQKVLKLHADIQKLDQQFAQLNATGRAYNQDGSFTAQANTLLQQRIALTKQLEQEAITGQQAQIKLEQQLREEKRQTEQAAKNAAKEAERQAKAEAAARKQAQDAANAENKARQEAYNARRRQGQETQHILNKEAKSIADITAKLQIQQQRLQSANIGSAKFNKIAEEVKRLTADLEKANQKMRELTGQTQSGAARQSAAVKQVSQEFKHQDGYVSRLIKRLAVYASFSYASQFLSSIREVTAQFELQRVSLGAILQDANKGEQIFSQIKQFALKSPISILDLTKYTKQLAAYKIGYDELFDTTKRLADISVGLGVDFQRIVLLYGQVRATGYLRASEVRQATEAGIPLVEELAAKLTKANGELVTAADVMDMISKRGISFEMVKDVFDDMTSAGGMFYNMQEKQGNTLYGLWAKLGDAASVMYDEIGNTESVNSGIKASIALLTTLMRNWKLVGGEMMIVAATMGVIYAKSKAHATATALQAAALNKVRTAGIAYNAILAQEAKLATSATIAQKASIAARKANAKAALDAAIAERTAANATNVWTRSMNKLKAAFMGNWVTILIAAIAAMGVAIYNAVEKANRLKNTLNSIEAERITQTAQSVRNFEYLADAAVKAADGSKEQKDALDELQRTYSDMIPVQDLTIEKLRALHGNYQSLTTAIKEYIAEQQKQKKLSAIEEEYGNEITDKYKKLSEKLIKGVDINVGGSKIKSWVHLQFSAEEFERAINELEKRATDKTKSLRQKLKESFEAIGYDLSKDQISALLKVGKWGVFDDGYFVSLNNALEEQAERIEAVQKASAKSVGDLGGYKDALDDITESVKKYRLVNTKGEAVGRDTFLFQQGQQNFQIKKWADSIKSELEGAGVTIQEGIFNLVDKINENDPTKISTIDFSKLMPMLDSPEVKQKLGNSYETFKDYVQYIQELYDGIVPSDPIVQAVRNSMFAIGNATKGGMDVMKKYLWDGKTSIEEHLKSLQASSDTLQAELYKYANYIKQYGILGKAALLLRGIDYDALAAEYDALTKQIEYVQTFVKEKDSDKSRSGTKSDNRLQNLQEIEQTLTKINQKYDELAKKEGQTKALEDINKLYANTLDYVNKLGKQFKLSFKMPTEFKDLQDYRKAILDVINTLKMKGYQKAALDLEEKIGTGNLDALQKDIEKQLKELSDRISRTKTAKEFYDKVLGMTGDYDLAAKVSLSVYGDTGYDLQKQLAEQIRTYFDNENIKVEIPLDVITADNQINYKRLGDFAEQMKKQLGEEPYKAIKKIAEEGQKDLAKTYEGYLKDLEKAKTYADKRIELARTTAAKIREMEQNPQYTKEQKAELKRGYQEREDREAAKLEYDAFKDTPLYVQMFEDLEHASTSTLEMMKQRLEGLSRVWGTALDPTQLKEIQSRMNEIDSQLRERNPFKTLKKSYQQYRDAVKSVSVQGAVENAGAAAKEHNDMSRDYGADSAQARAAEKELKAREKIVEIARKVTAENKKGAKALDAATQIANDNLKIARGHLELAAAEEQALRDKSTYEDPNQDPKVIAAHKAVEAAKEEVDLAERVAEITTNNAKTAKTFKESFASAANQVVKYMGMAGDLAHAVADTMEALGGDEDDVQFWNDIGTAIDDLTAGFQGITDVIQSAMSGNVMGVISSAVGIIPNMVKGFVGLFSAGKVRRANKEIKSQQKLLDQLEYTYGRLEKAADKVFGHEYLNNYNQQLKILQAQQQAYLKQAEAERSKGKKKDEDKIKEYENQARDTADKIIELQDDLVSQIVGTDVASAARDFANAWLDAYLSFGSTTDAIKEKFDDMIKNMIVNMVLAQVVKRALEPIFKMIDELAKDGELSAADISKVMSRVPQTMNDINNGLTVGMEGLKAAGFDISAMRDRSSEFSGIAKSVAGATSEEINNVAAIGNTLMYYVSPIPRMDENLARIRAIMENGAADTATTSAASTGWTDWQQQAMDNYTAIQRNTADTVVECRRAANACEKFAKAIVQKGATAGLNVFLKN